MGGLSFVAGGYNLVILRVRADDEGAYQCQLSAAFADGRRVEEAISRPARLSVLGVLCNMSSVFSKILDFFNDCFV